MPAGPSGSPMSPAESTSAASEPSAWPSWPPKSAPPSVVTIDCIGPSWARASGGTRSPIAVDHAAGDRVAQLRHTSSVLKIHSLRFHASADRMPEGSADAGLEPQVGQPQRLLDRVRGRRWSPPGRRSRRSWLVATWRARSQLTGPLPGAASSCCSWARNCCICCGSLGSGGWPPGRAKPNGISGTCQRYARRVAGHRHAGLSPGRTPGRATQGRWVRFRRMRRAVSRCSSAR